MIQVHMFAILLQLEHEKDPSLLMQLMFRDMHDTHGCGKRSAESVGAMGTSSAP